MKRDIETKKDIELLVNEFYERVKKDDTIGFIFTTVRKINWERHLPVMYDFWDNVLFYSGAYRGNPLATHKNLHKQIPLTQEYFDRWIAIFKATVDNLFSGTNATHIKERASSISEIMQIKILDKNNSLFNDL